MPTTAYPKTVYLLGCPAETDTGGKVSLIGLFDVEEFWPVEPSAFVYSPTFVLSVHGSTDDYCYGVDAADFEEQVDPSGYARYLRDERLYELQQEAEGERWMYEQAQAEAERECKRSAEGDAA